jgi:integrase
MNDMQLTTTTTTTIDGSQVVALYCRSSNVALVDGLERILRLSSGQIEVTDFPWHRIEPHHATTLKAELRRRYKPATVNLTLAALRGLFRALYQSNVVSADHYQKMMLACKSVRGSTEKQAGRYVGDEEVQALIGQCDDSLTGSRDRAILLLLFTSGLRADELCSLDVDAFDLDGKRVLVDGKGDKVAYVPLHPAAIEAIRQYLALRGDQAGPLFYSAKKGGTLSGRRLTRRGLNHILSVLAEQAGIEAITSHDGRRKVASDLLDRQVDIATVQAILRHSDPKTTARYDRRAWHTRQDAIETLMRGEK